MTPERLDELRAIVGQLGRGPGPWRLLGQDRTIVVVPDPERHGLSRITARVVTPEHEPRRRWRAAGFPAPLPPPTDTLAEMFAELLAAVPELLEALAEARRGV